MNVYSDDLHTAVDFLSREALNIPNLLYMGGDFNIRDAEWDPSVSLHPTAGQSLRDLADFYSLVRFLPVLSVPTHYSDINGHANSVIDLIFLGINCAQVTHCIEPNLRQPLDLFFFLFINLLHSARSQSMADYLQQVAYSFRGLRGQKPHHRQIETLLQSEDIRNEI